MSWTCLVCSISVSSGCNYSHFILLEEEDSEEESEEESEHSSKGSKKNKSPFSLGEGGNPSFEGYEDWPLKERRSFIRDLMLHYYSLSCIFLTDQCLLTIIYQD